MNLTDLSLVSNVLAFLAVAGKTVYDLYLNPRRFKKEFEKLGDLEAARRKRQRMDRSTAITFLLLAVSYLVLIVEAIQ